MARKLAFHAAVSLATSAQWPLRAIMSLLPTSVVSLLLFLYITISEPACLLGVSFPASRRALPHFLQPKRHLDRFLALRSLESRPFLLLLLLVFARILQSCFIVAMRC